MLYEELKSSIKDGKIAPLYIFQGQEEFLIEHMIGEVKKVLIEEWSEMMNFKSFAEMPPVNEAEDFLETLPVMAERKLAVFRKCGLFSGNIKNKAQWEKIIKDVAPFNCVIIWEDALEKNEKPTAMRKVAESVGVVVDFPLRTEANLKTWIAKFAASKGKTIDQKNALYLINSLERKMRVIKTEFEKILSFSKGTQITREDIDAVIVKPAVENVFNVIDAIFDGRREVCYNLLYTLRSLKQEPVNILAMLSGQLLTIYKAKLFLLDGKSHRETSTLLGGGFKNEMCTRKAEKAKLENIQMLINLCFEADKNIKQGKIAGWTALETIIAEYKFY